MKNVILYSLPVVVSGALLLPTLGCSWQQGTVETSMKDDGTVVDQTVSNSMRIGLFESLGNAEYRVKKIEQGLKEVQREVDLVDGQTLGPVRDPTAEEGIARTPVNPTSFTVDAQRLLKPDGTVTYRLVASTTTREHLQIAPDSWLGVAIGDEVYRLDADGESERGIAADPGFVTETQEYLATQDILRRIAAASTVQVNIYGVAHSMTAHFTQENFRTFQGFVDEYADHYSFTVSSNLSEGVNTQLLMNPGERVRVTATGVISYDYGRHYTNPNGLTCTRSGIALVTQIRSEEYPHGDVRATDAGNEGVTGSLIAWVGERSAHNTFFVGEDRELEVMEKGYLYLSVNDAPGEYDDNRGEFTARVRLLESR